MRMSLGNLSATTGVVASYRARLIQRNDNERFYLVSIDLSNIEGSTWTADPINGCKLICSRRDWAFYITPRSGCPKEVSGEEEAHFSARLQQ